MIKEWDDRTSWGEIAKLAEQPKAFIVFVAATVHGIRSVERRIARFHDPRLLYSTADSRVVFGSGAALQLATIRDVCVYRYLHGFAIDAVYLLDSDTWRAVDRDCVQRELMPMLGRKCADANV